MTKAIIFDLDGTLADTLADIGAVVNRALSRRGFPEHSISEYRFLVGKGLRRLVADALPVEEGSPRGRELKALIDELHDEVVKAYAADPVVKTTVYPGVPELLAALKERRVPAAVLSNKVHAITEAVVTSLFPANSFIAVLGETERFPRKPDPASAAHLAGLLGFRNEEVLFVGDSEIDVALAKAAGMPFAGAAWGFRGEAILRAAGADFVLKSPAEILELI